MSIFRRSRTADAPESVVIETEPVRSQDDFDIPEVTEVTSGEAPVFEDLLVSLDPKIQSLGTTWQSVRQMIDSALHGEDSRTEYSRAWQATIPPELHIPHGARNREIEKALKKELPLAVSIAVVTARYEAHSYVNVGEQAVDDHPLLHQNAKNIFPEQRALFSFEQNLCKKMIPAFFKVESLNGEVVDTVASFVGSSLESANEFVNWLQNSTTEERRLVQPLLAALASDVLDPNSQHKLEQAFNTFRSTQQGILVEEFVELEMDNDSRAQTLMDMAIYAARLLENRTGSKFDPRSLLLETVADWPENVKADHEIFKNGFLDDAWKVITEQLAPFASKIQRIPTEKDVEELLQRRRPVSQAVGAKALKGARVTQASSVSSDFINIDQPEAKERRSAPAQLGLVVRNDNGKIEVIPDPENTARQSLNEKIEKYCSQYPHDKTLASNLQRMVSSILADPYGRGTINIDDGKTLFINGKEHIKPRRLQPVKRPGLSVGSIAKSTRITYYPVKTSGSLSVVIEGIRDHDDYMTWIG